MAKSIKRSTVFQRLSIYANGLSKLLWGVYVCFLYFLSNIKEMAKEYTEYLEDLVHQYSSDFFCLINSPLTTVSGEEVRFDVWIRILLEFIRDLKDRNKSLYFIGNGASAAISSHFATDFTKRGKFRAFSFNDGVLLTCFNNDYSLEASFSEILKCYMQDGDCLFAISSSGQSKNVLEAVRCVKENYNKSKVVTYSGISIDNPLRQLGDFNLYLNSSSYGPIESGHSFFIHMLLDLYMKVYGNHDRI
ncbi:MAG: SIS domain-containing protein [Oligoflexia bacterium]|nr:SIS domain-containing protein [Oligoflexia bacterium]